MMPTTTIHKPLLYILLFLLLAHAFSQVPPSPVVSPCPVVLPTTRIVGGTILLEAPYMVFIRTPRGACSGALITSTQVLTARHCEITSTATAFVSSTNGADGIEIPISSTNSHPTDDVALVTLSRSVRVEPAGILANPSQPTPWSFVRAQGYGRQSFLPFPSDQQLRFVDMPVISSDLCTEFYERRNREKLQDPRFPDRYLCTGYPDSGSCSPCQGDSGGPLVAMADGKPVVIGVISEGVGCGIPDLPGLAVRITSVRDWLDSLSVSYTGVTELDEIFVDGPGGSRGPRVVVNEVQVGLSSGAIAGIVVGTLVALLVAVLAAVVVVRYVRKGRAEAGADGDEDAGEDAGEGGLEVSGTAASLMPYGPPDSARQSKQPVPLPPISDAVPLPPISDAVPPPPPVHSIPPPPPVHSILPPPPVQAVPPPPPIEPARVGQGATSGPVPLAPDVMKYQPETATNEGGITQSPQMPTGDQAPNGAPK